MLEPPPQVTKRSFATHKQSEDATYADSTPTTVNLESLRKWKETEIVVGHLNKSSGFTKRDANEIKPLKQLNKLTDHIIKIDNY